MTEEERREKYNAYRRTEEYKTKRRAYNAYRRTEEYNTKRRATRDLSKERERWKKYYEANKEKLKAYRREYMTRPGVKERYKEIHRKEYTEKGKERGLENIKNISDSYVKMVLVKRTNLTSKDIPKELVEVKRLEMLIRREYLSNTTPFERYKESKKKYLVKKRKLLTKESQDEKLN